MPPTISTIKPSGLTRAGKGWSNDTRDGLVVVGFGGHLEELESFHNLAPIVDAVLVDIDKSGQVCYSCWIFTIGSCVWCRKKLSHVLGDGTRVVSRLSDAVLISGKRWLYRVYTTFARFGLYPKKIMIGEAFSLLVDTLYQSASLGNIAISLCLRSSRHGFSVLTRGGVMSCLNYNAVQLASRLPRAR